MGDQQDCRSIIPTQSGHLPDDLGLGRHIQRRGGFIRQQQLRLIAHGHGNAHSLLHTAGELKGIGAHDIFRAWQSHSGKHLGSFFPGFFFCQFLMGSQILRKNGTDFAGRIHHGPAVLKNHGNLPPSDGAPLLRGNIQKILSVKYNIPLGNSTASRQQPQDPTDHAGFPAAALAHQTDDLTRLHM